MQWQRGGSAAHAGPSWRYWGTIKPAIGHQEAQCAAPPPPPARKASLACWDIARTTISNLSCPQESRTQSTVTYWFEKRGARDGPMTTTFEEEEASKSRGYAPRLINTYLEAEGTCTPGMRVPSAEGSIAKGLRLRCCCALDKRAEGCP